VEKALDEELARFLAQGPTKAELERAKTEIRASFTRGVEQVGGRGGKSGILAENAVYGGRPDFYKHSLELMRTATPQQVLATTRTWIKGAPLVLEVQPFSRQLKPAAGGADRKKLAMPTSFPDAPFPTMSQATLANGMRLIVAERHAVPVVQFSLQLNAGFAADQFAAPGVANMTMEMLDEGTA